MEVIIIRYVGKVGGERGKRIYDEGVWTNYGDHTAEVVIHSCFLVLIHGRVGIPGQCLRGQVETLAVVCKPVIHRNILHIKKRSHTS